MDRKKGTLYLPDGVRHTFHALIFCLSSIGFDALDPSTIPPFIVLPPTIGLSISKIQT